MSQAKLHAQSGCEWPINMGFDLSVHSSPLPGLYNVHKGLHDST